MLRRTAGRSAAGAPALAGLVAALLASPVVAAAGPESAVPGPASSAAVATPPRLLVSDDGDVWERHLSSALFDGAPSLVPGASSTASFWVKNLSEGPAVLRTSVTDVRASSPALAEQLSVTTTSPDAVAGTTTVALGDGSCTVSTRASVLAAGQEVVLDVDLSLDERATEAAAEQSVEFTVLVTLTGTTPQGAPPTSCAAPTGGDAVGVDATSGGAGTPGTAVPSAAPAAPSAPGGTAATDDALAVVPGTEVLVPARGQLRTAGDGPARQFVDLPVPSFVPVPLRETWLPVAAALVAALAGATLAVVRRRRHEDEDAS